MHILLNFLVKIYTTNTFEIKSLYKKYNKNGN